MGTSVVDPDLHQGEKSNPDPDQRDADPDSNPDSKRLFRYRIGSGSAALTYSIGNNSVTDPDPGLGAFLTPGSGIRDGRKPASGSEMNNPDHIV
jgi:hypothetical protein